MKVLGIYDLLQAATSKHNKWGILISFTPPSDLETFDVDLAELTKAAPWFFGDPEISGDAVMEGFAIVLFDSEEEMDTAFDSTVGDDGPTKVNSYSGPTTVFACTCDPNGLLLGENT